MSVVYRFKDIGCVVNGVELVDQCLSKTMRKTPTVVHPQFKITRIRAFYMRKVKYCADVFSERLMKILEEFPRLDDIHPFYGDLCNVLYDRDHYKLALGQVNSVRLIVESVAKEYVRLLKYADSPYKCKMLKRAALGRMATCVKKLSKSLVYLEQVRQHLGRLPGINPFSKSILLAGHPNVGKSSFMNLVSKANVEVQPFPFTTKAPFLGHFDYQYQTWQVIDTPGLLDRPLAARNTIELTALTALAHINCTVLFFIDISEDCGFSLEHQISLFHSLNPILSKKPTVVVLNKADLKTPQDLTDEEKALLKTIDCQHFAVCSTLDKTGIDEAKNLACELLVTAATTSAPLALYTAEVAIPKERPPIIPHNFKKSEEPLERDLMNAQGGAGVYIFDERRLWNLREQEWKYDILPEFMDGKNISDFIDPDIDSKIQKLEEEEKLLDEMFDPEKHAPTAAWYDYHKVLRQMYFDRVLKRDSSRQLSRKRHPRSTFLMDPKDVKRGLDLLGIDSAGILENAPKQGPTDLFMEAEDIKKLNQLKMIADSGHDFDEGTETFGDDSARLERLKIKTRQNLRMQELTRRKGHIGKLAREVVCKPGRSSITNPVHIKDAAKIIKVDKRKFNKPFPGSRIKDQPTATHKAVPAYKPKHLYSGKRGNGKTDWR